MHLFDASLNCRQRSATQSAVCVCVCVCTGMEHIYEHTYTITHTRIHRPDSKDFASGLSQARHDNGDKKARMDARTDVQVRASRQYWWSICLKILLILALARFFFGVGWLVIIIIYFFLPLLYPQP